MLGELAGGEWQDRAREAARAFGAGGDETDRPADQVQLLMDLDAAFGNDTAIFTVDLLTRLNNLEESPWGDRRRGEGLDARGLASLLRPFKIRPKEVRVGDDHRKGYHVDQFADAFGRYLPDPPTSATSATSATTAPQAKPMWRMWRMSRIQRGRRRTPRGRCPGPGDRALGGRMTARSPRASILPLALTPARAAAALDMSEDHFREHVGPELRWIRRGRKRVVAVAELDRWLERNASRALDSPRPGRSRSGRTTSPSDRA